MPLQGKPVQAVPILGQLSREQDEGWSPWLSFPTPSSLGVAACLHPYSGCPAASGESPHCPGLSHDPQPLAGPARCTAFYREARGPPIHGTETLPLQRGLSSRLRGGDVGKGEDNRWEIELDGQKERRTEREGGEERAGDA